MKKETLKQAERKYEGSPADEKRDRAGARKLGMPLKAYERSPQDAKEDPKNAKALQKKDNGKGMVKPR